MDSPKLAEKIGREHPVSQSSCYAHTSLVWLYQTLYYYFVRYMLVEPFFCKVFDHNVLLKVSQKSEKNTCDGVFLGPQHYQKVTPTQKFSCDFADFSWTPTDFVKSLRTAASERCLYSKVLRYPCSIEIWKALLKEHV